ncbi:MAG TPA: hypothetical protein VH560_13330 [Polyangia bacterium]|jgi:hypothetical protein|nr:hypothetical protein [Polyangia bacterium]
MLTLTVGACAGIKAQSGGGTAGTAGADAAAGAAGTIDASFDLAFESSVIPPTCDGLCADFSVAPILETGVPADAPSMFSGAPTGAGPCVTEPEDGALFPANWLRPRVKFTPTVPGTLTEIRVHSAMEQDDLLGYTTSDTWTMPKAIWLALTHSVLGTQKQFDVTITVRALGGGATSVTFSIPPVKAPGSIVFWAAVPADLGNPGPTSSSLQGFTVGDESTVQALGVPDVQMQTRSANNALRPVTCIGCHNSTPDGDSVAFIDNYPWNMAIAGVKPGRVGLTPMQGTPGGYATLGGIDTIRQPGMGIFSFSGAHWTTGDRIAVSPYYLTAPCTAYMQNQQNVRLAWLDLEAPPVTNGCPVEGKHFGIIAREGDERGAGNPTWSHDGKTIVYSSTAVGQDGRLDAGPSDLYQVPYNNRMGGAATPLMGAADPDNDEYYPAFSSDDRFVVFDRVPAGGSMYANPLAELYVVPATGAPTPTRLVANDPPKCSGMVSPGINNHWAKWAPGQLPSGAPSMFEGKSYYWLIFSSNRYGTPPVTAGGSTVQVSQLYATAIVVDETSVQTFPAIYLWNQNVATLNTTPAWDTIAIPPIP